VGNVSIKEKRKYERRPYVKPIRYFIIVSRLGRSEKIYNEGTSINISNGGLGMITDYPLEKGDILFFETEIKVNNLTINSSVVRWTLENNKKFMVGMEFIK